MENALNANHVNTWPLRRRTNRLSVTGSCFCRAVVLLSFFFSGLAPSWNYSHVKRYKSIVSIRVQIKTIGVNLFTRMHHWLAITTWGFVINSMLLVDAVREEDLCSDSVKGDIFSSSPIFFHSMSRHYRHKAIQYLIVLFCCGLIYSTVSTQPDPFLQQGCITSCKKNKFFLR